MPLPQPIAKRIRADARRGHVRELHDGARQPAAALFALPCATVQIPSFAIGMTAGQAFAAAFACHTTESTKEAVRRVYPRRYRGGERGQRFTQ